MNIQIGNILVMVNEKEVNFSVKKLPIISESFSVNERYKITFNIEHFVYNEVNIKCVFQPKEENDLLSCIESGENLALISFYLGDTKLSIGTEGDIPQIHYRYLDNGLELKTNLKIPEIVFYVAWVKMKDKEIEDIYTWFAADPSFDID